MRVLTIVLVLCGFAGSARADVPSFTLDWSEYPSWSVFGVAEEAGLLDGARGKLGELEKKHNVDIVLHLLDYDTCITEYSAGTADFVCITNIDVLSPCLGRRSTAVMATSTSDGGDGCLVPKDITSIEQLKGQKIHGLAKSVSQYTFDRNIEIQGGQPDDYMFTNMDPGAAALAFQQKQSNIKAIVVWNPFIIETLNKRKDAHVLFGSQSIPNEIVDMVVGANDSLNKEGGNRAALCIAETFYAINGRLSNVSTKDDTLIALGEKFADLTLSNMRTVVRQTRFYDTPEKSIQLFESKNHQEIMDRISDYCLRREITTISPTIAYNINGNVVNSKGQIIKNAHLTFDPSYLKKIKN